MENDLSKILLIATSEIVESFIKKHLNVEVTTINKSKDFYDQADQIKAANYRSIFCGPGIEFSFCLEVGQLVSNECPNTPLYFITENNHANEFLFSDLIKNGYTDIFLFPLDTDQILREMLKLKDKINWQSQSYMPIRIFDLEPDIPLPFDLFMYMPRNNKHIKFCNQSSKVDKKRINRLKQHEITSMFVRYSDAELFFKYSEDKFSAISKHSNFGSIRQHNESETVLKKAITEIFSADDRDIGYTQNILNKCKTLVTSFYKSKDYENLNLYQELLKHTGYVSSDYSHVAKVASAAAILSNVLKIGSPEDIAIAGLFHDLVLFKKNEDFHYKHNLIKEYDIGASYSEHAEDSVKLLRKKNIPINHEINKIITDHHEKADGTGFPGRKIEKDIHSGAQVLSFADQLIYLTSTFEGHKGLSISQAIDKIESTNSISKSLIENIRSLTFKNNKTLKAA